MTQRPTSPTTPPADPPLDGRPAPAGGPSTRRAGRRLGCSLAAAALIAAGLTVAACGKDDAKAMTILNTEKVERAIEHSVAAQRGKKATVSCPSGVHQKKGLTFSCTATVKKVNTQFVVTQQDGIGRVRYAAR